MKTWPDYTRFPQVQMERHAVAFGIDFLGVWLLSSLLGGRANFSLTQGIVFLLGGTGVLIAYRNRGQSFGCWALDMKVLAVELGKVPSLQALMTHESIVGLEAILAAIALHNFFTSASNILLLLPLAIDCSIAFADNTRRQAGHELIARTIVASSLRGYLLDIKVKRFIVQARQRIIR